MDAIKLATPEQVERIRAESNLSDSSRVLAMGEDLAVLQQVTEVDPVFFAEGTSNSRKLMFIWGIENFLRLIGTRQYAFNIHAKDEAWQRVVETHGARTISTEPELRFVKDL